MQLYNTNVAKDAKHTRICCITKAGNRQVRDCIFILPILVYREGGEGGGAAQTSAQYCQHQTDLYAIFGDSF